MTAVVVMVATALLVAVPVASADIDLTGSNPAAGSTVTAALPAATLTFSEPVNGERITILLIGPPAAQESDDSGSPLWWIIIATVVLVVLVVGGVVISRRRRAS